MYQKRNNYLVVLSLYSGDYSKRFYLREISKIAKLPLKTTQTVLGKLEKDRIIRSAVQGKNKYFMLNLENIETKLYLIQTEVHKTLVFIDKYPLFKPFIKEIKNTSAPIIVFGSFAKFKAEKNSDVDMLIISKDKLDLPFHVLSYKIHEINLSEKEFMKGIETRETLVKEIEENHIILNNHCFFVNKMWDEHAR